MHICGIFWRAGEVYPVHKSVCMLNIYMNVLLYAQLSANKKSTATVGGKIFMYSFGFFLYL